MVSTINITNPLWIIRWRHNYKKKIMGLDDINDISEPARGWRIGDPYEPSDSEYLLRPVEQDEEIPNPAFKEERNTGIPGKKPPYDTSIDFDFPS